MVALARVSRPALDIADQQFAADAVAGLRATPKRIPAKYFYDAEGSRLFEEITRLPEYYPTRCEIKILRDHGAEIAKLIPEGAALIEFGAGSTKKVRVLLKAAPRLAAYVPVDICAEMLEQESRELKTDRPQLPVYPVVADICTPFELPEAARAAPARVGFFPGSTIGNFESHEAAAFLRNAANILGEGAVLIIGVDLIKAPEILNAAYNDKKGVTAEFNKNLLVRMNRELGANFRSECFEHHAFYNRERNRIEMHLASLKRQKVRVAGETIDFRAGETIHTENCYKYSIDSLNALAGGVGWSDVAAWVDPKKYFAVVAYRLDHAPAKTRAAPLPT
jgi:dimethylhistidine N-methyltransferase